MGFPLRFVSQIVQANILVMIQFLEELGETLEFFKGYGSSNFSFNSYRSELTYTS